MARDRRAACRSRRDSRRVADGSANLSRHTFAPSQEERRVAEATARGRLSRLQLARRRLATGVAGRQSRSLADRDHASKQGRHPRRGRLHESLRQRSSKHFLPHRLRSQNPEIRGTLTNPRHRALSGRQKPRNPAVLRFLLNHPARRSQPVAETHPGCRIHRRKRGRPDRKLKSLRLVPSVHRESGDSSNASGLNLLAGADPRDVAGLFPAFARRPIVGAKVARQCRIRWHIRTVETAGQSTWSSLAAGSWSAIPPVNSICRRSWQPISTLIHATSSFGSSVAWQLEVTFEEIRAHLGVETQRQWWDKAILRTTPVLLGLFSIITLWANDLAKSRKLKPRTTTWYPKTVLTFSDAIAAVRREIWHHQISFVSRPRRDSIEIPSHIWLRMGNALAHAA